MKLLQNIISGLILLLFLISCDADSGLMTGIDESPATLLESNNIDCPKNGFALTIMNKDTPNAEQFLGARLSVEHDIAYADGKYLFDVVVSVSDNDRENGLALIWYADEITTGTYESPYGFLVYDKENALLSHSELEDDETYIDLEITSISGPGSTIMGYIDGQLRAGNSGELVEIKGEFCIDWD